MKEFESNSLLLTIILGYSHLWTESLSREKILVMKLILLTLLVFTHAHAYLSYGDASDGDCSFSSNQTFTSKTVWNCNDLTVDAGVTLNFIGQSSPIQFRVKGTTIIDGTLTVSASGTNPGPGGGSGGDCGVGVCDGQDAAGATGGEGGGGQQGDGGSFGDANGGGGGGAGFSNAGNIGAAGAAGSGAADGTGGSAGASFVTAASLETTLAGGRGGGGGGGADADSVGTFGNAGDGGAGSGSIAIISKGDITLGASSVINAQGGGGTEGAIAPAGGASYGGDGGGGSGGAIYLVSAGNITANAGAEVNINGGVTTNGDTNSAAGGRGSDGILAIDDADGALTGSFNFTAPNSDAGAAQLGTTPAGILDPAIASGGGVDFTSDIETSCAYRDNQEFQYLSFLFAFMFSIILFSRFPKFSLK